MTDNTNRDWWRDGVPRRAGWLLTTIALGLGLVAASVANYQSARAAYNTLNRGHIEILEHSMRQSVFSPVADGAILDTILAQNSAAGLRYVALLDGAGAVVAQAGEPAEPITLPANFGQRARATGMVTEEVDGRIRAFLLTFGQPRRGGGGFGFNRQGGPPPGADGFGPGGSRTGPEGSGSPTGSPPGPDGPVPPTGSPPEPDGFGPRGGTPPSVDGFGAPPFGHVVIEFEPVVAAQLRTRSARSLVLGSLAAVVLTIAAVGFWRQSVQYESARREFEQRRRLSQLGEMSAVLAHEIRNPLASLKGNAQLLAERLPAGSRDRSKAERVVTEATRLEALTTDLLEFARSGPNVTAANDPRAFVDSAIEEVAEGGILLDASRAPERWAFDPERLRHALVNILLNAVQASPQRAPELRVAEEGNALVFEIRDFGEGIPDGAEERLFDPFYTTRTNGTGLGLAVARRAVEAHDGRIEVSNHPEGGAVFRIVLPRKPI